MPGSYQDILRPQVLTEVVRQVVASADPVLNFMGFQPGGSNEKNYGHGREGDYHIFDDSRKVAKARAPGTPAGKTEKQPMKAVHFVYPRMHDSVQLLGEYFHNLGQIGDPRTRDVAGKDMISRQTSRLMQRAANFRIAMTVGMMRDALYFQESGDDWYINYTSTNAVAQVNFRVPSGNKTTLNMTDRAGTAVHSAAIIDVAWSSPGADIPLQFARINQARAAQGVGPVRHVFINSIVWTYLIKNDLLTSVAGTSNPPFQTYDRVVGTRPDGTALHEYTGGFAVLPGVVFHISDEGLELWDGTTFTWTKHFSDTLAIMLGDPTSEKYTMYTGSEPIAEYDGGPETVRVGLSSWSKKTSNPTATEVYVLDNCLSVPHDPYDLIVATVA